MNPCPFKVYKRVKGESRKLMIARFASKVDAVNYAYDASRGRFLRFQQMDVVVVYDYGRVALRLNQGVIQ